MSKTKHIVSIIILISILLSSCGGFTGSNENGPTAEELVATAAFETLQAEAVADNTGDGDEDGETAPEATDPPATDVPATDPPPTNTSAPPSATPTPICNMVDFVDDMTIPDDTVVAPGETFTKVWRIKNNGACTWTLGYQIIFDSGDGMGAPVSFPMPSAISPNGTVDISIDMTAPLDEGTYRGDWKLRSADGIEFCLGDGSAFYVQIIVVEPTATTVFIPIFPLPVTLIPIFGFNVEIINSQAGSVNEGGSIALSTTIGDTSSNLGVNSFFKFDLSGIPDGATINTALIGLNGISNQGDPFGGLDCMRVYDGSYFPLDASDYKDHPNTGALARYCDVADLGVAAGNNSLVEAVQDALAADAVELIFVFNTIETDNDGVSDYLMIDTVSLIINYTP